MQHARSSNFEKNSGKYSKRQGHKVRLTIMVMIAPTVQASPTERRKSKGKKINAANVHANVAPEGIQNIQKKGLKIFFLKKKNEN